MFVEIPKGSINKYEYNFATKKMELDRVLAGTMVYPEEYGFIPETLDYDGDPLDVVCLTNYPVAFPCYVPIRPVGVLKMIDGGEADHKILAVNAVDPRLNHLHSLAQISPSKLAEIAHFFQRYKELEKKEVVIQGWEDKTEAEVILRHCQQLYQNYQTKIKQGISKKELVRLLGEGKV